jgi:hypothetical protein
VRTSRHGRSTRGGSMARKADFTEDEWQALEQGVIGALGLE